MIKKKRINWKDKKNDPNFMLLIATIILALTLIDSLGIHSWVREVIEKRDNKAYGHLSRSHVDTKSLEGEFVRVHEKITKLNTKNDHMKSIFWKMHEMSILDEDGDHGHIGMYGGVRHESDQ